jgi:hypothetical protein
LARSITLERGHWWAVAQKIRSSKKSYTVVYRETYKDVIAKGIRKVQRLIRSR